MGFDYDPALAEHLGAGAALPGDPGMVSFVNAAAAKGFAVFGVTGRSDSQRAATLANLTKVGFTAFAPERFFTKWPGSREADYITCASDELHDRGVQGGHPQAHRDRPQRAGGKKYDIVLNVGDQWSDLQGGYADRTLKLPNPTYYLPSPNLPGVSEPALAPKTRSRCSPTARAGRRSAARTSPTSTRRARRSAAYYNASQRHRRPPRSRRS